MIYVWPKPDQKLVKEEKWVCSYLPGLAPFSKSKFVISKWPFSSAYIRLLIPKYLLSIKKKNISEFSTNYAKKSRWSLGKVLKFTANKKCK